MAVHLGRRKSSPQLILCHKERGASYPSFFWRTFDRQDLKVLHGSDTASTHQKKSIEVRAQLLYGSIFLNETTFEPLLLAWLDWLSK